MATCPHCRGHLTEHHRCPALKRALAIDLSVSALVGGLSALAFVAIFDPQQVTVDLDALVFALGAVLALGVRTLFEYLH